jgi:hypothetical protein
MDCWIFDQGDLIETRAFGSTTDRELGIVGVDYVMSGQMKSYVISLNSGDTAVRRVDEMTLVVKHYILLVQSPGDRDV